MTGRSRLLLAVLLALLGVGAAVAPAAAGYPAPPSSVHTGTAGSAPSIQDEPRDWLRLSAGARHAHATALPDTWSVVCSQDHGVSTPRGRLCTGDTDAERTARGPATSRSSRAPPRA